MIVAFAAKAGDTGGAQDLFAQAIKIADNTGTDVDKAKAFLLLSRASDFADRSQRATLLDSAIKALNNLSKPNERNTTRADEQYLRSLDNVGNELRKSFKGLTKANENGNTILVEKVKKSDLRTFAMLGVLEGLAELLTSLKN